MFVATIAFAQNTAGISGRVADAKGVGVDAIVAVSGPSAVVRRVSTLPDGSFSLTGLPAGSYFVCAEATFNSPQTEPFVNSCSWLTSDVKTVQLVAGKVLSGFNLPMQRGQRFMVRVNDPGKVLPAPIGKNAGNSLVLTIAGDNGLHRNIPIVSTDGGGRTHEIVIPYHANHNVAIHSATFQLSDDKGQAINANKPTLIQAIPGVGMPAVVVNVSKGAK